MKLRNSKNIAIASIAFGALFAGVVVFKSSEAAAPDPKAAAAPSSAKPALTIHTVQPAWRELPLQLTANGSLAAWQEASVGAESPGLRLAEVLANVGDVVKRGQLLARYADDSVQADVAQARAGVAEASAMAQEATANADRVRTLQHTGTFSGQQITQYLTAEQTAKARVESAKAALAAQMLRLKHTQVLAPDSGVVSARSATVGAVAANGTELFRLIRQGRLEWRAEVTASELGRMAAGTPVAVTTAGGKQLQGKVRMVAPTVDPQTRLGLVYVDVPPMAPGNDVLPGMFARGVFELGRSKALTVPQQAVVVRDGFSYVFQVGTDQRVRQHKVQTGRRVEDRVEVLQGLAPDALLAASGAGFLNDGDLVKVAPAAPPALEKKTASAPVERAQTATK